MRWLLALGLISALAFAAGLRIDLKALQAKLQNRPDPNVSALLKMGITPGQAGYQSRPWWTFFPEDNLFNRFHFNINFGGRSKTMQDTLSKTQELKKKLGPGPGETVDDQAQQASAQARRTQSRVEEQVRNMQKQ